MNAASWNYSCPDFAPHAHKKAVRAKRTRAGREVAAPAPAAPRRAGFSRTLLPIVVVILCSVLALPAVAEPVRFPVVVDGVPVVRVVYAGDNKDLLAAIGDLKTYVKQITGAELVAVNGTDDLPGATLHIGETEYHAAVAPDELDIRQDGFVLKRIGEDLLIAGKMPYGTCNGVTTVLQDHFGVRWYWADPLFEVVPKQTSLTIAFEPAAGRDACINNPIWYGRSLWGGMDDKDFARRMRMTPGYMPLPYVGAGHSLSNVVPVNQFAAAHPDYFCLIDGKRVLDGDPHPCFTHPDMLDIFMKYIRGGGSSLGVNDNMSACRCERCLMIDGDAQNYLGMVNFSESYCRLIKRVAEQTAAEFPGRRLGIFAYQQTSVPPQTVDYIGGNVDVVLCQDTSQHFDRQVQRMDHDFSRQWVSKVGGVRFYGYVGINYWTPRYFPTLLSQQMKHLQHIGVKGWGTHWITMIDSSMPMFYMMHQFMWDADQDHTQLIDKMMTDLYAESAEPMKRFYDLWEQCWMRQSKGRWFHGMDNFIGEMEIYSQDDFRRGRELLDEAAEIAKDETVAQRIQWISDRYEWTWKAARVFFACRRAVSADPGDPDQTVRLSDTVVNAWKDLAAQLPIAEKLHGSTPASSHGKTFRVRAWALKQQVRDAVPAPFVRWSVLNEMYMAPGAIEPVERLFARVAADSMAVIEPLMVESIGAQARQPRSDGVLAPMIPKFKTPPSLDAADPAWRNLPKIDAVGWVFRHQPDHSKVGKYDEPMPQCILEQPAKEDQSATWQAGWDDECLYVCIEVADDLHRQTQPPDAMYKEDSVQIGLSPKRDTFEDAGHSWTFLWGGYKGHDVEFGLAHLDGHTAIKVWQRPDSVEAPESLIRANSVRNENSTIYTAAIDWNLIPDFDPVFRRSLGIALVINDNDNGTRRIAEYGGGMIHNKRPSRFAAVRLGG